jgi:CHAD domain-containing protein
MAQALTTNHTTAKHDIHKFRDIKPKLGKDTWMSWKRELLATARDRELYKIITGADPYPKATNLQTTVTSTTLPQLQEEWDDRNNVAYSQILLCISPELQTAIENTEKCEEAWKILTKTFESTDPSKISIVRTRYENYHMTEGQSVSAYLTTMKEFRSQLGKMGETIADSTHAATILRNLPESWRSIAQTSRMITKDPDDIEERLEA